MLLRCSLAVLLVACGDDGSSLPLDALAPDAPVLDAAVDARPPDAPTDGAPSSGPPSLPSTDFPDYTTFVDNGINIYWRDADDDATPQAELEYRMTYRPASGTATVGMDWRTPGQISHEAQQRMWTRFVPASNGLYEVWITVRDGEHNETDYPVLEAAFPPP